MPEEQEIRAKMHVAEDLQSIVRTMKTLAAVNIRQYLQATVSLDDYYRTVELGLQIVLGEGVPDEFFETESGYFNVGCIVFGSDQGLAGRFNDEIVDFTLNSLSRDKIEPKRRFFLVNGERAAALLETRNINIDKLNNIPRSISAVNGAVQSLLVDIDNWYESRRLGTILLFFNSQVGEAGYEPTTQTLLPLAREQFRKYAKEKWPSRSVPIYSMSREELFDSLVRQFLFVSLFRAYARSLAAENASRLASMQAAERNIQDRVTELTAQYRQVRQTSITQELLETAAGFEALTRPSSSAGGQENLAGF